MRSIFKKIICAPIFVLVTLITQAQTLVGTTQGNFDVSPTGAAVYSIPIATAKGASDLVPQISLTYNSQSGNGIAGYGFNIGGLSVITRGPQNYYFDGVSAPTKTTNDGALYLDGMRLICVSGTPGTTGAVYKPEVENHSKLTIIGDGLSKHFKLQTRDGKTYLYGSTASGRFTNNYNTLAWLLESIEDMNDNYMNYIYEQRNNYMYLQSVEYGQNRNVTITTNVNNKLIFTYENRNDPVAFAAFSSLPGKMDKRLASIKSTIGTKTYREYQLAYQFNTFSLLSTLTEKGIGSEYFDPLKFEWKPLAYFRPVNQKPTITPSTAKPFSEQVYFTADTNGDGKSDLIGIFPYQEKFGSTTYYYTMMQVYTSQSTKDVKLTPTHQYKLPPDINWSGLQSYKTGYLSVHLEGNSKQYPILPVYQRLHSSAPSEFGFYVPFVNQNAPFGCELKASHEEPAYAIADLNNDGVEEIIYIEKGKSGSNYPGKMISLSYSGNRLKPTYNDCSFSLPSKPLKIIMADFDSDGFVDMLVAHETGIRIYKNKGGTTTPVFSDSSLLLNSTLFNGKCDAFEIGDFNGDGFVDIVVNLENSTTWRLGINNGRGSFSLYNLPNVTIRNTDNDYYICFVQDFDGDGKSDLIVGNKSKGTWYKSTGTGMTAIRDFITSGTISPRKRHIVQGDFMGKGYTELLHYGRNITWRDDYVDTWRSYCQYDRTWNSNKLVSVYNGIHKKRYFSYITLADTIAYSGGNSSQYPVADLNTPLSVVYKTSDGGYVTSFKYERGKVHMRGKGFMGFSKITTSKPRSKKVVTNSFNYTNYIAYPSEIIEYGCNNKKVSTTTDSYNIWSMGKRYATGLSTRKTVNHVNGYTHNIEYTDYNSLHLPQLIVKKYGDDLTEVTDTSFKHDTINGNWIIGLPGVVRVSKESGSESCIDEIKYTYNTKYQVTEAVSYTGNGSQKLQTDKYTYTPTGRVATEITKLYNSTDELSTTYTYSANHRDLLSVTDPLNCKDEYTYDAYGRMTTHKNHKSGITKYQYDPYNRLINTTFPDGTSQSIAREWSDIFGWQTKITTTTTGQPVTTSYFDNIGREVRTVTEHWNGNIYVDKEYDILFDKPTRISHPTSASTPSVYTHYTYDDYNRVVREYETGGKDNTWSFTGNSVTENVDGIISTKQYDAAGRLIKVTDAAGAVTYNLRPDGQPSKVTPPGGAAAAMTFTYDGWGRQVTLSDPSAGTTHYTYDVWGNMNTSKNAKNETTRYTYDKYGRLLKKVSPETTTNYTYSNYNLTKEASTHSTRTWTYDAMDRITSESEVVGNKSLKKDYTYTNGNVTSTAYTLNGAASPIGIEAIEYHSGVPRVIKFNNKEVRYIYKVNERGQTLYISSGGLPGYAPPSTFEYDKFGNVTKMTLHFYGTNRTVLDYEFDRKTGNLTSWGKRGLTPEKYTYDDLGRLSQQEQQYQSPVSYYYNTNGSLTYNTKVGSFAHTNTQKPYELSSATLLPGSNAAIRNQQVQYTSFMAPASITENGYSAQLSYSGTNNRVKMELKKDNATQLTRYYLGNQYEIDETPTGTKEKLYIGGDYYTAPAVYIKENNVWQLFYINRDHLGSIVDLWTLSTTYSQDYDTWGRLRDPLTQKVYAPDNQPELLLGRGYTGHEHLPWFGLINMNARLYDPVVGRFLSPDPFVQMPDFSQNFNRYSYALNNPLKYRDPTGEYALIDDALAAVIGGVVNLFSNLFQGNLSSDGFWGSFGRGAAAFGSGAVSGFGALYPQWGGWVWGGATVGATNSWLAGGSGSDIVVGAAIGTFAGVAGGAAGRFGGQYLGSLAINGMNVTSPVLQGTIAGAAGGITGGYVGGFTAGLITTGDFKEANQLGLKGAMMGGPIGAVSGGIAAYGHSVNNSIDPWRGGYKLNYKINIDVNTVDLSPDALGNNVTLYRAVTGTENKSNYPLFMTEDPNYAAAYGSKVVKVTLPRSAISELTQGRALKVTTNSQYHIGGRAGVEYEFSPSVKARIVPLFKPN